MKRILLALALIANGASLAADADKEVMATDADMEVSDAWVRDAPPGAPMLAAYLTLHNRGAQDRVLVEVRSRAFPHVMLHSSEVIDGVARMHQLDKLVIPAHATVTLEPGGMHLMMPTPEPPLSVGDEVEFELLFGDGSELAVQAEVRKKP